MPGDPRLPTRTADSSPWPREAGALWVRFNLATEDERKAFEDAEFQGVEGSTYSIGYRTVRAEHKGGVRHIHDLDLFEYGRSSVPRTGGPRCCASPPDRMLCGPRGDLAVEQVDALLAILVDTAHHVRELRLRWFCAVVEPGNVDSPDYSYSLPGLCWCRRVSPAGR
ncbi:MAG: hypothetical protein M3443_04145 [Actinomycetota bacterium]|nr:hypothetical protein [Actinomycetota bacterium]